MGLGTGAATIFGTTGGVMEAALRTVYEVVTGKTLPRLELEDVRGTMGEIKEATIDLDGTPVKVAVANTLARAKEIMEEVKAGTADYTFIEIMACPNGCVGGGGTPIVDALTRTKLPEDYRALRAKGLYNDDENLPIRKSHETHSSQLCMKTSWENHWDTNLTNCCIPIIHHVKNNVIRLQLR